MGSREESERSPSRSGRSSTPPVLAGVPIVAQYEPPDGSVERRALQFAERLLREQPALQLTDELRELTPSRLVPAPAVHLDDLTAIPLLSRFYDVSFLQDRARLRAGDGDLVVSCSAPCDRFESYCEQQLGLGRVEWLRVRDTVRNPLEVAVGSWVDRDTRGAIARDIRTRGLRYIHPHMGNTPVWILAQLLRRKTRCPIEVIAPPPALTKRVNDKGWIATTVARMFGPDRAVPGLEAWNYSTLANVVRHVASTAQVVVIKFPDSAGGAGNFVFDASLFRRLSPSRIRRELRERLGPLGWEGRGPLLVGAWETAVICAPSAQIWIPPEGDGPPAIEGIYEQLIEGLEGYWVGSVPAQLPEPVIEEIKERAWGLCRVFQRLGYVGRCSFDLLLVGQHAENGQVKFVECNGRWGGASLPMTLMNRLFGDWTSQPYATRECVIDGLERVTFGELLEVLEPDLFDARTESGRLIVYNPGGLQSRPGVDVLALGNTWEEARHVVEEEVPARLRAFLKRRSKR